VPVVSDAMHQVSGAALPVAIGLLVLAAIARGLLWADAGDERARATARRSFEPLLVFGGIAAIVDVLALALAGDAGPLSFVVPLALAAGAGAVLWERFESVSPVEDPAPPEPEPQPEPKPAAPPAHDGSLWAGPAEEPAPRTTLWSGQ
jgi:hypothetical protein